MGRFAEALGYKAEEKKGSREDAFDTYGTFSPRFKEKVGREEYAQSQGRHIEVGEFKPLATHNEPEPEPKRVTVDSNMFFEKTAARKAHRAETLAAAEKGKDPIREAAFSLSADIKRRDSAAALRGTQAGGGASWFKEGLDAASGRAEIKARANSASSDVFAEAVRSLKPRPLTSTAPAGSGRRILANNDPLIPNLDPRLRDSMALGFREGAEQSWAGIKGSVRGGLVEEGLSITGARGAGDLPGAALDEAVKKEQGEAASAAEERRKLWGLETGGDPDMELAAAMGETGFYLAESLPPLLIPGVGPVGGLAKVWKGSRVLGRLAQESRQAQAALKVLKHPVTVAAGASGAAGAAGAVTAGASMPGLAEETGFPLFEAGASLRAGTGSLAENIGNVLEMKGRDGSAWQGTGQKIKEGFELAPVSPYKPFTEEEIKGIFGQAGLTEGQRQLFFAGKTDAFTEEELGRLMEAVKATGREEANNWLDPRFYSRNLAETTPTTLSLILPALISALGGGKIAKALGGGKFAQRLAGALAAAGVSRSGESLLEGGDTYARALREGYGHEEAKAKGEEVARRNMALVISDAAQWLVTLGGPGALTVAAVDAVTENAEERVQHAFQEQAMGTDTRGLLEQTVLDPTPETKQAGNMGMAMGAAAGGASSAASAIKAHIKDAMYRSAANGLTPEEIYTIALEALEGADLPPETKEALGGIVEEAREEAQEDAAEFAQEMAEAVVDKLPPEIATQVTRGIEASVDGGMGEGEATARALDGLAETPEGGYLIEKAAKEALEEAREADRLIEEEAGLEDGEGLTPPEDGAAQYLYTPEGASEGEPVTEIASYNGFYTVQRQDGSQMTVYGDYLTPLAPGQQQRQQQPESAFTEALRAAQGQEAAQTQATRAQAAQEAAQAAQAREEEARVQAEYEAAADPGIVEFWNANKGDSNASYELGAVSERQASDLQGLTGKDYSGFVIDLPGHATKHIENRHGESGTHDSSMADTDDIARIKYVLDNYDSIQLAGKAGQYQNSDGSLADKVIISKKVNGYYHIIEAVPHSKKSVLRIVSAYKSKSGTGVLGAETPSAQLPPNRGSAADETSVTESGAEVKAQKENTPETALKKKVRGILRNNGPKVVFGSKENGRLTEIIENVSHGTSTEATAEALYSLAAGLKAKGADASAIPPEYREAINYIRETPIRVTEEIKRGIPDFGSFRQMYMGTIALTKDGSGVGAVYQELSNTYPWLLDGEATHPSEQVTQIAEAVKGLQKAASNGRAISDIMGGEDINVTYVAPAMEAIEGYQTAAKEEAAREKAGREEAYARAEEYTDPAKLGWKTGAMAGRVTALGERLAGQEIWQSKARIAELEKSLAQEIGRAQAALAGTEKFTEEAEKPAEQAEKPAEKAQETTGKKKAEGRLIKDAALRAAAIGYKQARILDALAKASGVNIRFAYKATYQGKHFNAYYNGENEIILNTESRLPSLTAAVHELVHAVKASDKAAYGELESYVQEKMGEKQWANAFMGRYATYKRAGVDYANDAEAISEEVVADALGFILGDSKVLERFANENRGLLQIVADFFRALMDKIKGAGETLRLSDTAKEDFRLLEKETESLYRRMRAALELTGREQEGTESGGRFHINPDFAREIDEWDGRSDKTFNVGTTSEPLRSIGVKDSGIVWRGRKIAEIVRKHSGMTREIIKQVPDILENPVIVLKSQGADSRLVIFGEVVDGNGAPVTAILELAPASGGGQLIDMAIIASAYGKDSGIGNFLKKSELLYLDPDKNRTGSWMQGLGLQLPSDTNAFGSVGTVTYQDGKVKIAGVPFSDYYTQDSPVVNTPTQKNENGRFSLSDNTAYAPVFYSRLAQAIDGYKGDKISARGLESYLKGRGVKPEEIKWSGVLQFAEGKKSIGKDELLRFVRDNDLEIEELASSSTAIEGDVSLEDGDGNTLADITRGEGGYWILEDVTGEYREEYDSFDDAVNELITEQRRTGGVITGLAGDFLDRYAGYALKGGQNYREVLFTLPDIEGKFESQHWDEENVVAHTRLQDFEDTEGNAVLFVEEAQSDWHEKGREQGYLEKGQPTRAELDVRLSEALEAIEDYAFKKFGRKKTGYIRDLINRKYPYDAELDRLIEEKRAIEALIKETPTIPDAPWRNTWHELVMKRVLRMAAEGGYGKLAWTTGAQQADRYGLSKAVRSIGVRLDTVAEDGAPIYHVTTIGTGSNEIGAASGEMSEARIAELFGKDLGSRLIKAAEAAPGGTAEISGEDLVIGGEGMKNFYDVGGKSSQNIPRFMDKYVKQWGASVGDVTLPEGVVVPGVDITPEMKQSVLYEGQPKFSFSEDPQAPERARRILDMSPVSVAPGKALNQKEAEDLARSFGEMKNGDDGRVARLPVGSVGKIITHKGYNVTRIFGDFPRLYETALFAWSEPEVAQNKHKSHSNIREYRNYVNAFTDGNGDYFIRFTVPEMNAKPGKQGDNLIHSTAISNVEIYKNSDYSQSVRDYAPGLKESAAVIDTRLQEFFDLVKGENKKFSLSEPIEGTRDLIAVHNLTVQQLAESIKLGGFPMPSIAVTRSGIEHGRYGDVSVLFGRETVDPERDRRNKIYGGDAWTPDFPDVGYKLDSKVLESAVKKLNDIAEGNRVLLRGLDADNIEDKIQRWSGEVTEAFYNNGPLLTLAAMDTAGYKPVTKTNTTEIDEAATHRGASELISRDAYNGWLRGLFEGIIEKRGIRNSKGMFTPSGNMRSFEALYSEMTLSNIVKAMAKQAQKGGAGGLGSSFRGAAAREYGSIDAVRADKGRLRREDDAEMKALADSIENRVWEIVGELGGGNGFTAYEAVAEAVAGSTEANSIYKSLRGWGGIDATPEIARRLAGLAEEAAKLPTEYFEAKPQRAVALSEVRAVIVPDSINKSVMEAIRGAGLNAVTYKAGDNAARLEAVNKAADTHGVKFSISEEEGGSIKEQIRAHQEELNAMRPVAHRLLAGLKAHDRKSLDKILGRFEKIGYAVDRPGTGKINVSGRNVRNAWRYVQTDAEAEAMLFVPDVIKRGVVIAERASHKGRGYDTMTIAGPVIIGKTRGNMAVVLYKPSGSNNFKALRVLAPDGKEFSLEDENSPFVQAGGSEAVTTANEQEPSSSNNIAKKSGRVKAPNKDGRFSILDDPGLEERMEKANGKKPEALKDKLKRDKEAAKNKIHREFEHLPRNAQFAELRATLLRFRKQEGVAADRAIRYLDHITNGLDAYEYDIFRYKVIFDDLKEDAKEGLMLPFELTEAKIDDKLALLERRIREEAPAVAEAIEKRRQVWEEVKDAYIASMKKAGFNPEDRLTRVNYYHHQVLEFATDHGLLPSYKGEISVPTRDGFLRKREGTTYDINTDYLQAEFEAMSQMLHSMEKGNVIIAVKKHYDIAPELKRQAMELNEAKMMETFRGLVRARKRGLTEEEVNKKAEKEYKTALNREQAKGFSELAMMAARGELPDNNGRYAGVVEALAEDVKGRRHKPRVIKLIINDERVS